MVRLGIPASFKRFSEGALQLGAPILVSANAFWRDGRFRHPSANLFGGADVALDSAGFVAMARYGGYRWPTEKYVDLAASYPWTWWASMDFCCEPQIARDQNEIASRVQRTVEHLSECRRIAAARDIKPPLPVLQGWRPDDYLRCAALIGPLPTLVGIGSVCRRPLGGPNGLFAVLSALDAALPRHTRLHLFGVKGQAIRALTGHPRIASVDSMAWDFAARREVKRSGEASCHVEYRASHMRRWYKAQQSSQGLFRDELFDEGGERR